MRISGGRARGIPLRVPKGDAVRPATDGLRQSLFSSLGMRVEGAVFVDFCAGSGAYGLEAISRGAKGGVAVEKNAKAAECLRSNLAAVAKSAGVEEGCLEIATCDLEQWFPSPGFTADIIFADPPYKLIDRLAASVFAKAQLCMNGIDGGIVAFEMPGSQTVMIPGWEEIKRIGRGGALQPTVAMFRRSV
ncbi:MAG: RsmD family RNA methyltransferase [Opitutaceae bacterium]|nr:RsmD family RNA methyltransferase [Opitutaceae bacterium]